MVKPKMSEEELNEKCEQVRALMKNDMRTPEELFASLCDRLRQQAIENGDPYSSDNEVEQAVRRLIGLCETIMGIAKH
jgi:hypothetical protein